MVASTYNPLSSAADRVLDFSGATDAIDELDPSLAGGMRIIFDRDVPMELRVEAPASGPLEGGSLEVVRVKVLLLGSDELPTAIRAELTSECDLFFHYSHTLDAHAFARVRESQKLMVEFGEYARILTRMLGACMKEPHGHLAVFIVQRGGRGDLTFIQSLEHKFVELLSCACVASAEEVVRRSVTFRYNAMKSRHHLMQSRLQDLATHVKAKNPGLLLSLSQQRAPARVAGWPFTSTAARAQQRGPVAGKTPPLQSLLRV